MKPRIANPPPAHTPSTQHTHTHSALPSSAQTVPARPSSQAGRSEPNLALGPAEVAAGLSRRWRDITSGHHCPQLKVTSLRPTAMVNTGAYLEHVAGLLGTDPAGSPVTGLHLWPAHHHRIRGTEVGIQLPAWLVLNLGSTTYPLCDL